MQTPIPIKKQIIEEIILFMVLTICLIGMAVTDFSPDEGHRYWTALIFLLVLFSVGLGWSRSEYQGKIFKELVFRQLIHWGATLVTVLCVYLLMHTGRLNYESTGLVIELIIGLSIFLDGRNLGWRFSLLGVLVSMTAIIAAYVEEYFWVVLMVSLVLSVMTYYWEKYRVKHRQEHKHEN